MLGCHMGGRPAPGVSIRSWGTARGQREEHQHGPALPRGQVSRRRSGRRAVISKRSIPRSSQGDSSNQVGPTAGSDSTSTGELRRKERKQRALMRERENHLLINYSAFSKTI